MLACRLGLALALLTPIALPAAAQDPVTVTSGDHTVSLTPERLTGLPRRPVARIEVREAQ